MTYLPQTIPEEGVWTPTLFDSSANEADAYAVQVGRYQKTGNWVTFTGRIKTTDITSLVGAFLRIDGLPYTSSATSNSFAAISIDQADGLAITGGWNLGGVVFPSSTEITPQIWNTTVGVSALTPTQWSDDGGCMVGGSYYVD